MSFVFEFQYMFSDKLECRQALKRSGLISPNMTQTSRSTGESSGTNLGKGRKRGASNRRRNDLLSIRKAFRVKAAVEHLEHSVMENLRTVEGVKKLFKWFGEYLINQFKKVFNFFRDNRENIQAMSALSNLINSLKLLLF